MVNLRVRFDQQLSTIRGDIMQLSQLVRQAITSSMEALNQRDLKLAEQVDHNDAEINALRLVIEEQIYSLVALQQPNTHDMRLLMASITITTNLERMADHAAGIARLLLRMNQEIKLETPPEFRQMTEIALSMLTDAMQSFEKQNQSLVPSIVARDEEVDKLHKQVYDHLIQTMVADPKTIEACTFMLWISHNLERIADRIGNICERVVYLVTGELTEHIDPMP